MSDMNISYTYGLESLFEMGSIEMLILAIATFVVSLIFVFIILNPRKNALEDFDINEDDEEEDEEYDECRMMASPAHAYPEVKDTTRKDNTQKKETDFNKKSKFE